MLNPEYDYLIPEALKESKKRPITTQRGPQAVDPTRPYLDVADILAVNIGVELLDIVPGRVSTEVCMHVTPVFDDVNNVTSAVK